MTTPAVSAKTTIRVDLPPAENGLTRIVLGRKRPAEKRNETVTVKIKPEKPAVDDLCQSDLFSDSHLSVDPAPRKRRELPSDDLARQQLINKILTDSSRKLKKKALEAAEGGRNARATFRPRPDPPCIRLVMRKEGSFLMVPSAIDMGKLLNGTTQPVPKPKPLCACGSISKYRDPQSGKRFCSLSCFRSLRESM